MRWGVDRGTLLGRCWWVLCYVAIGSSPQQYSTTFLRQIIDLPFRDLELVRADRIPDLCDVGHVVGWEPYSLRGLERVSRVGSVRYRSCTSPNGTLGSTRSRS